MRAKPYVIVVFRGGTVEVYGHFADQVGAQLWLAGPGGWVVSQNLSYRITRVKKA